MAIDRQVAAAGLTGQRINKFNTRCGVLCGALGCVFVGQQGLVPDFVWSSEDPGGLLFCIFLLQAPISWQEAAARLCCLTAPVAC